MQKVLKGFKLVIVMCAMSLPKIGVAQIDEFEPSPCSGEFNVDDVPCPIDGGVSFLVAAGIGYGLKKAHSKKKQVKL